MTQPDFDLSSAPSPLNPADLPAAPDLLRQFLEAIHQKNPDFQHVASLVLQDAALCYRVLEFGRSTSAAKTGVEDMAEVLAALGPQTLNSLGMALVLPQSAPRKSDEAAAAGFGRLWERSLSCAHAAREIAELTGYARPDEACAAGLLHGIGRTLILHRFPEKYSEQLSDEFCAPILPEVERDHFGTTGAELAANLTADWHQLPFFSDALLYQDETAEAVADAPALVKLVNLACKLAAANEDGEGRAAAALLFDLKPEAADKIAKTARSRASEAAAAFNVAGGTPPRGADALSGHIRTAAALHGLVQEINGAGQPNPWAVMLRHLELLFGLPRAMALAYRPEEDSLGFLHASFDHPKPGDGFVVAVKSGRSLLSRTVLRDQPLFLEGEDAAAPTYVVDRQLQRLLGASGLFCVPLTVEGRTLGALAAGVDQHKAGELKQQLSFIEQFARTCAQCLENRRPEAPKPAASADDMQARMQKQIRGLVHEASNPLGVIRNYIHLLSIKLEDRQDLKEQMAVINEEIGRVSRILSQMKEIQPKSTPSWESVEINRLIADLVSVWRTSLLDPRKISDKLMLQKDIPAVRSCPDSLKQILTNLVKNAVEAMDEGGTLTIASRAPVNVNGRPHIEISVADDGPGLPREMLEKVFGSGEHAPKPRGEGLGLAIVKELVTHLGGYIRCRNRDVGGAEFILGIPIEGNRQEADSS